MRKDGMVVRWDSARGFGFIRSAGKPADVFFHAKDFQDMAAPHEGMPVTFEEIHVGGKGPRAMSVKSLGVMRASGMDRSIRPTTRHPRKSSGASALPHSASSYRHSSSRQAPTAFVILLMLGWMALVMWGIWVGRISALALALAPLLNLLTFWLYWSDKHAAQTGSWRTKEDTLHLFGLLGGWPGAWFAQQILRHKSNKASFRGGYWATVALHCVVLAGWIFWSPAHNLLFNS